MVDGKLFFNIFSEVRAAEHAKIKKPISKYFSPAGVAQFEPHVDAVLASLVGAFDERFAAGDGHGQPFDFSSWMNYCTFNKGSAWIRS
jgi:cytochrome P450